jgi:hypothetical protein
VELRARIQNQFELASLPGTSEEDVRQVGCWVDVQELPWCAAAC